MGATHEPTSNTIIKKRAFDVNARIEADLQKLQNYQGNIPPTFLPLKGGGQAVGSGTSYPILAPISRLGLQQVANIKINLAGPGAHYQTLALTNPGVPINISFTGLSPSKSIRFTLDILIATNNLPQINWPANLFNLPPELPTSLGQNYLLEIAGYIDQATEQYVVLSTASVLKGGVTLPNISALTFEDKLGQVVTDVNPAFKLLAKWKFEGFDPNEVTTRRPIWAMLTVLTANLKSNIGTNTASIRTEGSKDDITYNASAPSAVMQTSSTNILIGRIERNTGAEFGGEPGQANHFVRIIVDTNLVGSSATYKNLKFSVLMIMPLGVTVKKIFPI